MAWLLIEVHTHTHTNTTTYTGHHVRFKSDSEVICTSVFSNLDPWEDGEIFVSLINGRPGTVGPSVELQEFTKAKYVRLRLQKMITLNADFMVITRHHDKHDLIDQSVTRRVRYC
jgi:laminin alpha 1/2